MARTWPEPDAALPGQGVRGALARYAPAGALVWAAVVLWQIATVVWDVQPWLLPAPSAIIRAAWEARVILAPHIWQTAQETLWGFALALAVGLSLGIIIDRWTLARDALYPLLVVSQTIPTIAIAPLLVIWFGYGIWPKIIVVGLICFFPIVVSTADGLRAADPEMVALLRTMGASRRDQFTKVRLPAALPAVFSGIKIAITYSVVGAILGEWVGASRGLGVFMLRATNSFRTDWVFASIAITAVLSIALFGLVAALERVSLPWYYTAAREECWEEL
jgi:ABC-type nitrate/sulfonate/bicarbonate transport system permease component